jgi:hypothetical protein
MDPISLLIAAAKIIPAALTATEVVKRIIPNDKRAVINPAVAGVTALYTAYAAAGIEGVIPLLIAGLLGALGAMGTYSGPKWLGKKLNIK